MYILIISKIYLHYKYFSLQKCIKNMYTIKKNLMRNVDNIFNPKNFFWLYVTSKL